MVMAFLEHQKVCALYGVDNSTMKHIGCGGSGGNYGHGDDG